MSADIPEGMEPAPDQIEALRGRAAVDAQLVTWLAIHGNLQFALRHPGNRGPSSDTVRAFVSELEELLVERGVLTAQQLAYANGEQVTFRES